MSFKKFLVEDWPQVGKFYRTEKSTFVVGARGKILFAIQPGTTFKVIDLTSDPFLSKHSSGSAVYALVEFQYDDRPDMYVLASEVASKTKPSKGWDQDFLDDLVDLN